MKLIKKPFFTFNFFIIAIILTYFFWQEELLLSFLLITMALIKHYLIPIKKEFAIYTASGFIGALAESVVISAGAWQYAETHIFNIPLYLPFLWGAAGTVGVSIYLNLINNKS